jgi:VWFA-related protein
MKKGLAVAVLSGAVYMVAQEPLVLRSTTRLVQVSVIVQDKNRNPVPDLKQEDFEVYERGKPQRIAFFSAVRSATAGGSATRLPPNVFSNRLVDRGGAPTSVTAVVIDTLNTPWTAQAYARRKVAAFLSEIRPEDRVALFVLGRGLSILHDYTGDSTALVARIQKWRGDILPEKEGSEPDTGFMEMLSNSIAAQNAEKMLANYYKRSRILNTLQSFEAIAKHLAAVPGRKNLIWVSGSFPLMIGFDDLRSPTMAGGRRGFDIDQRTYRSEVEDVMRALNHANVAVYPVDARGLMADPRFGTDNRGAPSVQSFATDNLDTMQVIAERTGGKAYFHRNDIDGAIREVFNESAVTYAIGYYPEESAPDAKWREIRVRVKRPGLTVRHRMGYTAFGDLAVNEAAMQDDLRKELWSPLDATAVGLIARVNRVEGKPGLRIALQIDASTVSLARSGDRWQGRLDVAVVAKAADGAHLSAFHENIGMNLLPTTYDAAVRSGILFETQVSGHAKMAALKIVVRDAASGLTGSITVPAGQIQP